MIAGARRGCRHRQLELRASTLFDLDEPFSRPFDLAKFFEVG